MVVSRARSLCVLTDNGEDIPDEERCRDRDTVGFMAFMRLLSKRKVKSRKLAEYSKSRHVVCARRTLGGRKRPATRDRANAFMPR